MNIVSSLYNGACATLSGAVNATSKGLEYVANGNASDITKRIFEVWGKTYSPAIVSLMIAKGMGAITGSHIGTMVGLLGAGPLVAPTVAPALTFGAAILADGMIRGGAKTAVAGLKFFEKKPEENPFKGESLSVSQFYDMAEDIDESEDDLVASCDQNDPLDAVLNPEQNEVAEG